MVLYVLLKIPKSQPKEMLLSRKILSIVNYVANLPTTHRKQFAKNASGLLVQYATKDIMTQTRLGVPNSFALKSVNYKADQQGYKQV